VVDGGLVIDLSRMRDVVVLGALVKHAWALTIRRCLVTLVCWPYLVSLS
jgi:hypothetical protein